MEVRRAKAGEGRLLSEVALRSKAYWGYDSSFIEACREALTISEAAIASKLVYVLADEPDIIGFYSFVLENGNSELDSLFIAPEHIGRGYGQLLWSSILQTAKELGISEFTIDSDPYAEGFYKKMGAIRIGEVASTVFKDRKLPLLKVVVV